MPSCCNFCCGLASGASVIANFCACSKLLCTGSLLLISSMTHWINGVMYLIGSACLFGIGPLCVPSAARSKSMLLSLRLLASWLRNTDSATVRVGTSPVNFP